MRDDARLAAARAGQDQHRTFGGRYRFTLLGIETRKENPLINYFTGEVALLC